MEKGATGVELLAPIRPQLSGFARVCHTLAVVSVFGLGATWIIPLLTGRQPPFRPVLLTMLILWRCRRRTGWRRCCSSG
jgi:hypothetical protein